MTDADLMKFANDHEESSNLYSLTTGSNSALFYSMDLRKE